MSYTSPRLPKTSIISNTSWGLVPRGVQMGRTSRQYSLDPFGSRATPWTQIIAESEWIDRVKALDDAEATHRDIKRSRGVESLNQASTNFCWCNAPVQSLHYLQARYGSAIRRFSPASVGSHITGFRNVGGWGHRALERLIESGVNEVSDWPANAIDRRYANADNAAKAKLNAVTEWYDLPSRDFAALFSCLLMGHTVSIGMDGHEVLAIDPAYANGQPVIVFDNSWGNWGDGGLAMMSRSKASRADGVAPRVLTPRGDA